MQPFDQLAAPGYPVFLGSEISHPAPEDAFFHIIPVPYEASVSFGDGTAQGPATILEASWQLEAWEGESRPADMGIYTRPPVDVNDDPSRVMEHIAKATTNVLSKNGFPVVIGGEHTVTYGVIKGLLESGITNLGVIQIDAHADLRDAYEGNRFSHASVMKRIADLGIPIFQLGVRAYCEEEIEARQTLGVQAIDAEQLVRNSQQSFTLPDNFPDHVFFTLDIDGLDPSVFPSTGTPVPGGLGWYQTLSLFESVLKQRKLVGFDLMEFAPIEGFHAYQFSAALLIYKMMGLIQRNQAQRENR